MVDGFARFYLIPGQAHGEGIFRPGHDWLSTLEAWVEQKQAPGALIAKDQNVVPATVSTNGRTRPLCQYGSWPKYVGAPNSTQAQANDATNFVCEKY